MKTLKQSSDSLYAEKDRLEPGVQEHLVVQQALRRQVALAWIKRTHGNSRPVLWMPQ